MNKLKIHSEVKIFIAANKWLQHNSKEARKYAKDLLFKVILTKLIDYALVHLLNNYLKFKVLVLIIAGLET